MKTEAKICKKIWKQSRVNLARPPHYSLLTRTRCSFKCVLIHVWPALKTTCYLHSLEVSLSLSLLAPRPVLHIAHWDIHLLLSVVSPPPRGTFDDHIRAWRSSNWGQPLILAIRDQLLVKRVYILSRVASRGAGSIQIGQNKPPLTSRRREGG